MELKTVVLFLSKCSLIQLCSHLFYSSFLILLEHPGESLCLTSMWCLSYFTFIHLNSDFTKEGSWIFELCDLSLPVLEVLTGLKCLSFLSCCVSPPGGHCRTTAARWPVSWGARPAASRGIWTMLLFLTFLTWVALHLQEAEAAPRAALLLRLPVFCHFPSGSFLFVHSRADLARCVGVTLRVRLPLCSGFVFECVFLISDVWD